MLLSRMNRRGGSGIVRSSELQSVFAKALLKFVPPGVAQVIRFRSELFQESQESPIVEAQPFLRGLSDRWTFGLPSSTAHRDSPPT
jgi:hypothetical protein